MAEDGCDLHARSASAGLRRVPRCRNWGAERQAVRGAVTRLRLVPVMFELGARPYPPRPVYRAYLAQSQVFVGIYW